MSRTPAALFTVALALGAAFRAPEADADGPRQIKECRPIDAPGSYALVRNLTARGDCLIIAADFVTLDLNGWTITGDGTGDPGRPSFRPRARVPPVPRGSRGAASESGRAQRDGRRVRARDIPAGTWCHSRGGAGPQQHLRRDRGLATLGAIVRGNTASNNFGNGIAAGGIVSGNTALSNDRHGIIASGIISGNFAEGNGSAGNCPERGGCAGIIALSGSTVSGNTAFRNPAVGITVECPSNVIGNTATFNGENLVLDGEGCNSFQNLEGPAL